MRTILDALHARKIYFRRLREKPVLTDGDIAERKKFAEAYRGKPAAWWTSFLHLTMDVKCFRVYLNGKARAHAAQEKTRGAYRAPGEGLEGPYTRASKG